MAYPQMNAAGHAEWGAPPPAAPTRPATVNATPETLRAYTEALATIRTLQAEQVPYKLQQARLAVQEQQRAIAAAQQMLGQMQRHVAEAAKKVDKTEGWYPGKKLLGKSKHEDKAHHAQDDLHAASQQVEAQQQRLAQLQAAAAGAAAEVQSLEAKAAHLASAQAYEASVVEGCFKGAAGDDRENALEAETDALKSRMDEIGPYRAVYRRADGLMTGAEQQLTAAAAELEKASRLAGADMMQDVIQPIGFGNRIGNSPGGLMIDLAKRQAVGGAAQAVAAASRAVRDAQALVPSMPPADGSQAEMALREGAGGGADLVFDNMLTDMASAKRIKAQAQAVAAFSAQARAARDWVRQWTTRIDSDYAVQEGQYNAKKAELDVYRRQLLERVVAGQA